MTETDQITVYSDYVCPFCYLGRESLSRYQDEREEPLRIDWRPFDLRHHKRNPDGSIDDSVEDGKDDEYYEQARDGVRRLQERYDVEMELELAGDVDSLNAQIASYHVKQTADYETWLAFDTALFEALWQESRDIGDPDVLADIAESAGVSPETVRAAVDDEGLREELRGQFTEAKQEGVTGVPTFGYDGYAARGAVPPEQLQRLVDGS